MPAVYVFALSSRLIAEAYAEAVSTAPPVLIEKRLAIMEDYF